MKKATQVPIEELMTPREVAALFRVDAKTVTRWAKSGRIRSVRTIGGHCRLFAEDVRGVLATPGDPQ